MNKKITNVSYDLALQFSLIIKKIINNEVSNNLSQTTLESIIEELSNLTQNTSSKDLIKKRFFNSKNNFQSIIYAYTTNKIYREFNKSLTYDNYQNILETLSYCFSCVLEERNQNNNNLFKIYRGTCRDISLEYKNGNRMFWKAFISTSESLKVENFTTIKETGTIFEINLSKKFPHPYLKIPQGWSEFPIEQEVLLWPNFPFHIMDVERRNGINMLF